MRFESRRGPEKKLKKTFSNLEIYLFNLFIVNFPLFLFFCTSKMIVEYF